MRAEYGRDRKLSATVERAGRIDTPMRDAMFQLYADYYRPADPAVFFRDLAAKTHVIVLRDGGGALRGFSTIKLWPARTSSGPATFLFSGDTIIAREFWGSQALPFRWIEFAGSVKAADPATPLYWLLISKGHRTYRLLSAFARAYYPTWRGDTPPGPAGLMAFAGRQMFGDRFDEVAGIVRHVAGAAALLPDYAQIDPAQLAHPEIAHFVKLNPGFVEGDELLCLCELSSDNLQPMARVQFLRGHDGAKLGTAA